MCCCSVISSVQFFADPTDFSTPGCSVLSLLKFMSIELVSLSNRLILCCRLLLLPSVFPSIRIFSSESALSFKWPEIETSASASVLLINIQSWSPLGLAGLILQSKGLSRVFSSTTVRKHQVCGAQLSLWSNSHIHTWLLEKLHSFDYPELGRTIYHILLSPESHGHLTCAMGYHGSLGQLFTQDKKEAGQRWRMLSQDVPGSSQSSFLICSSSSVFSTDVFQEADTSLSSSKGFLFHWVREVRRWGRQEVKATGSPELGRSAALSGFMSQELRWTPVSSLFSWQPEKPGISPEAWES